VGADVSIAKKHQRLALRATACVSILAVSASAFVYAVTAANATVKASAYPDQIVEQLVNTERSQLIPWAPDIHPVTAVYNREAVIPPQCYTRTEGVNNPCYVCHQNHIDGRENKMNDGELQAAYSFSDQGMKNHWRNLFEDRSARAMAISDQDIIDWINTDNYSGFTEKLNATGFAGWVPGMKNLHLAADAFDEFGFALDGSHWVAFNYKPLPSTFWPTNGSTDDVMIKLPEAFRSNAQGDYSTDVYRANLALLEAAIKGVDTLSSLPVDERKVGADLNSDGVLEIVEEVQLARRYVGAASKVGIHKHLYPAGTEFMHTVRYVGVDEAGNIGPSTRLKEIRYMKKWRLYSKEVYARNYQKESFEKEGGYLPGYRNLGDHGLDNGFGWSVQSFIEDYKGELRVSTYEENLFCMGCHKSVGSQIDKTYSFARKIDGAEGWGYIDLKGMPDTPNHGEEKGEILTYFERAGGGDEFRSNSEMFERWFNEDGTLKVDEVAAADVYTLTTPSRRRALDLNKAYRVIVKDQNYVYGREARLAPPENVYEAINNETSPTLKPEHIYSWDIRLDWSATK